MLLEKNFRALPHLISAYDDLFLVDHAYDLHNMAFFTLLRRSLQAFNPVESLEEMIYTAWETRALIPMSTVIKETDRERKRRLAREAREARLTETYREQSVARALHEFGDSVLFLSK